MNQITIVSRVKHFFRHLPNTISNKLLERRLDRDFIPQRDKRWTKQARARFGPFDTTQMCITEIWRPKS